jgi:hypothetical protein
LDDTDQHLSAKEIANFFQYTPVNGMQKYKHLFPILNSNKRGSGEIYVKGTTPKKIQHGIVTMLWARRSRV